MRLLVTGATGFIGRFFIPYLLTQPDTAVSLLLREQRAGQPLPPPLNQLRPTLQLVYADLRSLQLTTRAVREAEPDIVVHLAAVGATDPFLPIETAVRHNLTGTANLVQACFEKNVGIQQLIVARTPGELSAMNVYAASKASAWNFCQMYARTRAWPVHGVMIFQAYGPGQPPHTLIPAAIAAAQAGEDFAMTSGRQERDWIYVGDVAAGLTAVLGKYLPPGDTVALGSGRLTSVAEVVQQIYALVNKGGKPLMGVLPDRPGEETRQVADVAKTKEVVGWETAVSLPGGLQETLKAYRPF